MIVLLVFLSNEKKSKQRKINGTFLEKTTLLHIAE